MNGGGMESYTPYDATFSSTITFNTNINEMESRRNIQNYETNKLLQLLLKKQGIGKITHNGKSQGKKYVELN